MAPKVVAKNATISATWTDFCAPRRIWAMESWPMSSVPIGWAQEGEEENWSVMSAEPYFQKRPPMSEATTMMRNTTRLPTASLWARNRRTIICVWVRAAMVNSRSGLVAATSWTWMPCSVGRSSRPLPSAPGGPVAGGWGRVSAIADPWVKHRVQQVRDEIEQHHDHGCHRQPGQQDVGVGGLRSLHQQGAHALPGEDPLGDDRTAEDRAGVDRHHRHQRDQRVAQGVADHHPRP